jgi:hypothetical protein
MSVDLVDLLDRLQQEARNKQAEIQAAEIRLGALKEAYSDIWQKEQAAQKWLQEKLPGIQKVQAQVREWLKDNP